MNISIVQAMIDAIDKPAIFINPSYAIEAVNQPYRDTYPVDIKLGFSTCYQVSHRNNKPCDKCGEHCPMQESKTTGRAASVVHVHTTSEGQSYCDILMRPIFDGSGELLGFLEILDKLSFASNRPSIGKMVGESEAFKTMLNKINRAANSDISVLLFGETGTGKELVSQALHSSSHRANKPFIVIECTGMSDTLLESELFGYEKGAFTGANKTTLGKIETAQGGTLFLDEIGDMPIGLQAKMLRFLQERVIERVGGRNEIAVDVRVVCATHRDLSNMVQDQTFREDLYYRIGEINILIPPLRERDDDVILLAKTFLNMYIQEYASKVKGFSQKAINAMLNHRWPGNIRELQNKLKSAVVLAEGSYIEADDLGLINTEAKENDTVFNLREVRELAESKAIRKAYHLAEQNMSKAAELLGVTRPTLYSLIDKYHLDDLKN